MLVPEGLVGLHRTVNFSFFSITGLEEAQAGIKIAGRNINNCRYANISILMAESEELKSLLMKVKEESEEVGFSSVQSLSHVQLFVTP